MPWVDVLWDHEQGGNVDHIGANGISVTEVEEVLRNPTRRDRSRSSGRPISIGYTGTGRRILVVYEELDAITAYPITAYELT